MVHTRRSARLGGESASCQHGSTCSPSISFPNKQSTRSIKHGLISGIPHQRSSNQQTLAENDSQPSVRKSTRTVAMKEDIAAVAAEHLMRPVTAADRQNWKGWVEIESEPAFFNVILRDLGVQDIKVQEVITLDEEMLACIPKPVYGLIFLSQYQKDNLLKQKSTLPDHVWFANQTTSNACASIAMLNIVMNVPGLALGPNLESLKSSTATLSPAMRGYQVCNNEFVRRIHNSFTRQMDILDADLALSNESHVRRYSKGSRKRKRKKEDEENSGFHFVAYVPIKGSVWELDGLEQHPTRLGSYNDDWMDLARPMIAERMQQYEGEQIQFNLLSLCKSPLLTNRQELARNIQSLTAAEFALSFVQPNWRQHVELQDSTILLRGPNTLYGVTKEMLDAVSVNQIAFPKPEEPASTASTLLDTRMQFINAQGLLKAAILDEDAAVAEDNEKARCRRYDYTPMVNKWVRLLAENGLLKRLYEEQLKLQ